MSSRQGNIRRAVAAAVASLAALALAAPAALAQGPWPFDGQNVYSFRSSNDSPGNVGGLTQAWKRTFDGDVTGTPIVASNGGVYIGTWSGEVHGIVYTTGQTHWARGASNVGGPVAGSLLYANNTVYAVASPTGSPRLVALDPMTGDAKWSQPTVLDTQGDSDAWGSPTYSAEQNLIYVGICACKAERDGKSGIRTRGAVVAVDATTGAVVWKTSTVPSGSTGGGVAGTPLVFDFADRVYVTTGHAYGGNAHQNTDSILALDTATGQLVGRFQAVAGDNGNPPNGPSGFVAGPIGFVDGGAIRVGAGARNGRFYAVDYQTMAKAWEQVVGVGSQVGGIVSASAWDGRNMLFGVSSTPTLYWALQTNGSGGLPAWVFPGTDGVHAGPVSFTRDTVWSTDTAGFLDIQYSAQLGRPVARQPLGAPSSGGVSFGFRRAFVSIGTGRGTGGGVIAYR